MRSIGAQVRIQGLDKAREGSSLIDRKNVALYLPNTVLAVIDKEMVDIHTE